MYPAWKSTFDAHIYEGRVIQVVLMKTSEEALSEATVGVSVIAERCKKGNGHAEFWVDLQPSGKVMMSVQFFVDGSDQGRYMQAYILFKSIKLGSIRFCIVLKEVSYAHHGCLFD